MHVSLTPTLKEYIQQKVASGFYNNASEVIREALRLMNQFESFNQTKLERLRQEVAYGAEQAERGEFSPYSLQSIIDELDHA